MSNPITDNVVQNSLPTLYQYYTHGGITSGLSANQPYFTLNEKNITIYSGAMHYFRVPPQYWRDRLRKMRAAGLNTVETYVPWNLHEPINGHFDFGQGGTDFEQFLDIPKFLKTAKEEDLFVIVRPGPYICAEWDFGGLPSWLLRQNGIKMRTSDPIYMKFVKRYFNLLLGILAMFQFSRQGPIIAIQVENEYSHTYAKNRFHPDKIYLQQLWDLMVQNGIVELLVTSDGNYNDQGSLPDHFLMTINFQRFSKQRMLRPAHLKNKPTMVMEFWVGWFDHWTEYHHKFNSKSMEINLLQILGLNASVNFYMFHGGTSWGFMNGANVANNKTDNSNYQPDTSSYDYDAPIGEHGQLTPKYETLKRILVQYNQVKTVLPEIPEQHQPLVKFSDVDITGQIFLNELLKSVPEVQSPNVMPMEFLPINNQSGQSFGYIVYRKTELDLPARSVLRIDGHVCDSVVVLVNGFPVTKTLRHPNDLDGFGFWRLENSTLVLNNQDILQATLDLLVENWGRVNFFKADQMNQLKGLWQGGVFLNDEPLEDWLIYPLEFQRKWTETLTSWHGMEREWVPGPALYMGVFEVFNALGDTYVNMGDWHRGIVIVNGFILGRYCRLGPQQTLYLPRTFLRQLNTIVIFEQYQPGDKIQFAAGPIYKTLLG